MPLPVDPMGPYFRKICIDIEICINMYGFFVAWWQGMIFPCHLNYAMNYNSLIHKWCLWFKKQIKSKKERRKIINKGKNEIQTGHIDNFSFVKGSLLVLRASWYTQPAQQCLCNRFCDHLTRHCD